MNNELTPIEPKGSMEPTLVITTVTGFAVPLLALLALVGLPMSDALQTAIVGLIAPTVGVIFLMGFVIRSQVVPVAKVDALEAELKRATDN